MVIANAYFLPDYHLLRALRHASGRGVRVQLVLQGVSDVPLVRHFTTNLYDYLVHAGIEIHELRQRPLHSKVAVVDDDWATIGSSKFSAPLPRLGGASPWSEH